MITLSAQWETVNIRAHKTVNTGAQTEENNELKIPGFVFCYTCFYMAHLYKLQQEHALKGNFSYNERLYLLHLEDAKWLFYTYLCIPFI